MPELKWAKEIFSKDKKVDEIWGNWTKISFHSSSELAEIVYGQFEEEFQKRALFLLLVPDFKLVFFNLLPPNCTPSGAINYLSQELDFRKVETGLRSHAIYWLTKFIDYARYEPALQSQKAVLLDAYNKYILQLLAVLPAEDNQAETIFPYFSINDPTPWKSDMDGCSGYNPLLQLWKNPRINEHWKRLADSEIRQTIKRERRGEASPREPWENALQCYARHLQSLLPRDGGLPYNKEFLAEQIDFLTSLKVVNLRLIKPESIALILPLFAKERERYKGMWNRFVRFAILQDGNFKIYSEQTEEAAQLILKECDTQIYQIVQTLLNHYQQALQEKQKNAENVKRAKEALLAPMRKIPDIPPNENQSER